MKKIIYTVLISVTLIISIAAADYAVNSQFFVVKTASVTKEKVTKYIKASGTLKEQNRREICVELPFRIDEIYVEAGDKVAKEQKLFKLDKEKLKSKLELGDNINQNTIAKINNYNTYVTSPINGVVTKINVNKGDTININNPLAIISDFDNLIIKAQVPESVIADIYTGQNVVIKGKSFIGEIKGTVYKIYPVAEKNNNYKEQTYVTVDVKSDKLKDLKPEVSVELEFEKESKNPSITVPFDSVMFDEDTPYVYVNKFGYAVKRYVNLGEEYETDVEILSGLKEEESLILNPKSEKIIHGGKVTVIK